MPQYYTPSLAKPFTLSHQQLWLTAAFFMLYMYCINDCIAACCSLLRWITCLAADCGWMFTAWLLTSVTVDVCPSTLTSSNHGRHSAIFACSKIGMTVENWLRETGHLRAATCKVCQKRVMKLIFPQSIKALCQIKRKNWYAFYIKTIQLL